MIDTGSFGCLSGVGPCSDGERAQSMCFSVATYSKHGLFSYARSLNGALLRAMSDGGFHCDLDLMKEEEDGRTKQTAW